MPQAERPDMAGYGVTRDIRGLLPWSWAEDRLIHSRSYWLVSANAAGRPHSRPVWGVWMPRLERWYMGCSASARKARNMRDNARVVVTTEDPSAFVSLEGRAVRIEGQQADAMARVWVDKYHDGTSSKDDMVSFLRIGASFEVVSERAFGMIENPDLFASSATRWVWSAA